MAEQTNQKPGALSPAGIPGTNAHTDTKGANTLPVDSVGRSIEVGDTVNLQASVTGVSPDGKLNLEISHPNLEGKSTVSGVHAGMVTHSGLNPRIGAAPQLRTPAVELPAKNGGVKPVARGDESTAGLPTAAREKSDRIVAA